MSKLTALLAAGAGTAAVSVGGVYLFRGRGTGFSETGEQVSIDPSSPSSTAQVSPNLQFDSLQSFKDGKGGKCGQDVFGTADIEFSSANGTPSETPTGNNFFGVAVGDTGEKTKGCLIINWEKKTGSGESSAWNGIFTWTGAFVNGDKGFITFNVAKTKENGGNKEIDLTGGFYLFEKLKSETNKWSIKGCKEIVDSNNKKVNKTDFETNFPKAKDGSVVKVNGDYGGFVSGKDKLEEISNDLTSSSVSFENKKGLGQWKKDAGVSKIGEGSSDLKGWDHMYDKNSTIDLQTKLGSFSGTGTLYTANGAPAS